jgi:hypothetical protein
MEGGNNHVRLARCRKCRTIQSAAYEMKRAARIAAHARQLPRICLCEQHLSPRLAEREAEERCFQQGCFGRIDIEDQQQVWKRS